MTDTSNWTACFPPNLVEFTNSWREDGNKYQAEVPFENWLAGDNDFYKCDSLALDTGLDPCELGFDYCSCGWYLPVRVAAGGEPVGTVWADVCCLPFSETEKAEILQRLSAGESLVVGHPEVKDIAGLKEHGEPGVSYEEYLLKCMPPEYRQSFVDWRAKQ